MTSSELYIAIFAGIILIAILSVGSIQFTILFYRQRNLRKKEEEKFQQELLRTQLEIQEQTLKNVSAEIHDNIGQTLSLAKLNLAMMEVNDTDPLSGKISSLHELVSKAIQDLRDLSKSLNTDYVSEKGLLRSIEYELEMIGRTGALQTEMKVGGTPITLDKKKELILFRIVQECLNNAIKHAQASNVIVAVDFAEEAVSLQVQDNGRGFDQEAMEKQERFGLGLKNLQNRAALIGAGCTISGNLSKGTEVLIQLPLPKNNNL